MAEYAIATMDAKMIVIAIIVSTIVKPRSSSPISAEPRLRNMARVMGSFPYEQLSSNESAGLPGAFSSEGIPRIG